MEKRSILLTMLLLLVGVGMQAQSGSSDQMDERFNDNKMPYGWFADGWEFKDSVAQKKASAGMDMSQFMGNGENSDKEEEGHSYNFLMTPPLNVQSGEVLSFSAKKGESSDDGLGSFMGGGDNDTTFVVERCVYGEYKWIRVADFTKELGTDYKTFSISSNESGEFRFRFRAGGNVLIDSVAGFQIDMNAPDLYPIYQKTNIKPVDLGLCKQDTTITFGVVNTATGTLTVNISEPSAMYTIHTAKVDVEHADTVDVDVTFKYASAHEGRNSTLLSFKSTNERLEEIKLPIDAVLSQPGVWMEDFNQNKLTEGWYTEGWEAKEGVASVKEGGGDGMMGMFGGGGGASFYLMTPPLKVNDVNDVLLFSVMKPGGDGGMDFGGLFGGGGSSAPSFFIEKSVYGSGKWEMAKDFSNVVDTVFTTQWLSGLEPGEYRFRFLASDSIVIDSVAGFHIDMNAPDIYVTRDSAAVQYVDMGMLRGDSKATFNVINTGTGTLGVNLFSTDMSRLTIKDPSISVAAGDTLLVDATMLRDEERQGEVDAVMLFMPTDQRVSMQAVAIHAYIIKSDSWSEDFEPLYVVEDRTYPRIFPEGWTSTGWVLTDDGGTDMMAMFGGGDGGEKTWVAKSDSREYEMITPRLQAKKGNLLRFTAQIGGMASLMQMFGMGGPVSYLSLYYKRDKDKDWTLYNNYFTNDTIVFKAPYSGFYQLKFQGSGVSLDDFYGFSLPKDSLVIPDVMGYKPELTSMLEMVDGQTWNVSYDRKISARVNDDGTVSPVAASVCLPYEFNIDDYYEPGMAKIYQMEYVDTIYNQFIFHEMPDNLMEAGKPYMIIVSQGEIQFSAVDAKITSKVAEATPVYDFTNWWWNFEKTEVATWNGSFDSVTGSNQEYVLQDNGGWERLWADNWIRPFRAYLRAGNSEWWIYYRQNPNTYTNEQPDEAYQARSIVTRFYQQDGDGNGEVAEMPGLYYIGDINGSETNGIVAPTIHTIDRDGTHNYYDMQGRRLNEKPRHGVYILNGKKYVAR